MKDQCRAGKLHTIFGNTILWRYFEFYNLIFTFSLVFLFFVIDTLLCVVFLLSRMFSTVMLDLASPEERSVSLSCFITYTACA